MDRYVLTIIHVNPMIMECDIVGPSPQITTNFATHPIQGVVVVDLLQIISNVQRLLTVSQEADACISSIPILVGVSSAFLHVMTSLRFGMNGLKWTNLLGNAQWTNASLVLTAQVLRNVSGMLSAISTISNVLVRTISRIYVNDLSI